MNGRGQPHPYLEYMSGLDMIIVTDNHLERKMCSIFFRT